MAFVIYDILPITNPDFFGPKLSRSFAESFHNVCRHADLLLAISDTVRDQLRALLEGKGDSRPQGSLRFESFRLGAELDMWHSDAYVRLPVRSAFDASSGPAPYLMVGTIEPRKNHLTVLDAFDRLWDRGSGARLVLVGRRGWKCGEIEQRLRTHPRLGEGLVLVPRLVGHGTRALLPAREGDRLFVVGRGLRLAHRGRAPARPAGNRQRYTGASRSCRGSFAAYFDPATSPKCSPTVSNNWKPRAYCRGFCRPGIPARDLVRRNR